MLHLVALARGVTPNGPSRCAVCGSSAFGFGRLSKDVFGANFTDHAFLAESSAPDVCAGCVSLLSGRPGDDPPPLRTMHALATSECIAYPGTRELRDVLVNPPLCTHVVIWATSRKRHAVLRAGLSTPEVQIVGSDYGAIAVERHHLVVLEAVERLLGYTRQDTVLAGAEDPVAACRAGPARWARWCAAIAPYVGHPLLDLFVAVGNRVDPDHYKEEIMLDPADATAAGLIARLADASALRSNDGLRFWRSTIGRRVAARSRLPLADCISRLLADLACCPTGAGEIVSDLAALSATETADVEAALRTRGPLVIATAFQQLKESRHA